MSATYTANRPSRSAEPSSSGGSTGWVSPSFFTPVRARADEKPKLFVIVDTEEEFDWSKPFSRDEVGVTAIQDAERLQAVVEPHGVKPTYVIDFPVASTASSAKTLGAIARRGGCHIGAHLHPWVSPPHTEVVSARASYACNLGADLERDKITRLKDTIEERVGVTPRSYKAGRYGFARSTAATLEALGFDLDLSVSPHLDHSGDGGPSFAGFSVQPGFFGQSRRLLEVPCTIGFVGSARKIGAPLHRAASADWLRPIRAVGLLSRSGMLNKIMLSPEGSTLEEMKALTRTLYADGLRAFSFTFHSPSLKPGCTRYVRTENERDAFLNTIDDYCQFFLRELGGVPGTPADYFDSLTKGQPS